MAGTGRRGRADAALGPEPGSGNQHPRPFFLPYPILRRYADLRLDLRPRGQLIGDVDTLIAATALERRLAVVTLDGDIARIPGLAVVHLTTQQLR